MTNCSNSSVAQLMSNNGNDWVLLKSESGTSLGHSRPLEAIQNEPTRPICVVKPQTPRPTYRRPPRPKMKTSKGTTDVQSLPHGHHETAKNAARERTRVKSLRVGFQRLQNSLPSVPADTKLSKLDILILATNYISHLSRILAEDDHDHIATSVKLLHPIKKWPMRSRLYANHNEVSTSSNSPSSSSVSSEMAIKEQEEQSTLLECNTWDFLFADINFDCNLLANTPPLVDHEHQDNPVDTMDMIDSLICL